MASPRVDERQMEGASGRKTLDYVVNRKSPKNRVEQSAGGGRILVGRYLLQEELSTAQAENRWPTARAHE